MNDPNKVTLQSIKRKTYTYNYERIGLKLSPEISKLFREAKDAMHKHYGHRVSNPIAIAAMAKAWRDAKVKPELEGSVI